MMAFGIAAPGNDSSLRSVRSNPEGLTSLASFVGSLSTSLYSAPLVILPTRLLVALSRASSASWRLPASVRSSATGIDFLRSDFPMFARFTTPLIC